MLPNKIKTLLIVIISSLSSYSVFAQGEVSILPVYNPSHLQIKVTSNGKSLNNVKTIDSNNKDIEFKAFSLGNDSGSELVIPKIEVDLVRGGRLIASETIGEKGNISSILELAEKNDVIRFLVNGIYIKNTFEKLELYSLGTVNLIYSIAEQSKFEY
ncbi:hypothetical protein [Arcticibacterium luteifluviistationis]|uniref:Uncharacterized protein n=1 Tax=Arcticibacterium luteifluviistationis TaxID=1784714 RepID=A0A2Z4G8L0_9BACT|nr:hypothetical protein [Arcticibacterium luteifluviistationis]AWV97537.1 hypothetical protein DJ013_04895 [Arcticibacterium luteifluviistationis]